MIDLKRFERKLVKAREKRKYKQHKKEEVKTVHAIASARRQETELHRKADITKRRAAARESQAKAEEALAAQRAAALASLKHKRTAKRKRIMSERELRQEQLRPILEAPKKLAKSIKAGSEAFKKLGTYSQEGTLPSSSRGTPSDPFPGVTSWLNNLDQKMK